MIQNVSTELYKKHRPTLLKGMYGQAEAVGMVKVMLEKGTVPHTILFTGPSGCGKTTLARILRAKLNCSEDDFAELNCSDFRGIDMVRDIRSRMGLAPINGVCRIWLIDECHELTKQAQEAFLKILEDTPRHVYFLLATTEPSKLLPTIKSRCTEVRVKVLSASEMLKLLHDVSLKEKTKISDDVLDRVVTIAEGSARKALVLLHQVIGIPDENEQLASLEQADTMHHAIELARELINPRCSWSDVSKLIKTIEEEPEQVRRMLLGYCANIVLSGGKSAPRCCMIIDRFGLNFFDSGKAGLVLAAWDVVNNGKR